MVIEKLIDGKNLSESEKQIASFVLNKQNHIDNLTSTELGKRSYTSQSTVIRLYQKLGIKSYREFLSLLIVERNEFFKSHDLLESSPEKLFSSCENVQTMIPALYNQVISDLNLLLDRNTVNRVCNRIMNAQSIDVYGLGVSSIVAKQLVFKLQSLGMSCAYHGEVNSFYIQNTQNNKKSISIVISLGESHENILKICQLLKEKNIYTISICHKDENDIIDLCQDNLFFTSYENEYINMICSFFSVEYIINIVYPLLMFRFHPEQLSYQV